MFCFVKLSGTELVVASIGFPHSEPGVDQFLGENSWLGRRSLVSSYKVPDVLGSDNVTSFPLGTGSDTTLFV